MILPVMVMILLPLLMATLLLWAPARPWVARLLGFAPAPALLLLPAAWEGGVTSFSLAGGWSAVLDRPAALMLAASTLLWIIGGFAASRWLAGRPEQGRFALWWLLTLSGSLGVFVAGDIVSFYALYALASLPAYGLIVFEGGEDERRAGRISLAAALVGEGLILAAFVLLSAGAAGQGIAIGPLLHALPALPQAGLVITLVVVGFGLKIGLVPLHGWMPMTYAAGPIAATAVLSGATSKAGIIGLIRFLPLEAAMPVAGGIILAAGLVSAFYGALAGLTQDNPRSVLAYSSVSQLGQMAAVLGAGLAAGVPGAGSMVAFYAAYHVLTKGGLFLMLGTAQDGRATPRWNLVLTAFMALGFAGLPLSGGALGKLAVKDVVGGGLTGLMFALAAVGSTVLMLHFMRLVQRPGRRAAGGALPPAAWLASAVAATVLQWSLFSAVTGLTPGYALAPGVLVELLWPIALGAVLAWGLAVAGTQLPRLAPGDLGASGIGLLERASHRLAPLVIDLEGLSRRWPVSSLLIVAVLILFVVTLGFNASG